MSKYFTGDCCEQLAITENEGRNATIQCKYPEEFKNSSKIFCKEQEGCKPIHSNKKYSMADNKIENVFNVTIYNVVKTDSGIYWCGMKPDENYAILLSEVVLNISGEHRVYSHI